MGSPSAVRPLSSLSHLLRSPRTITGLTSSGAARRCGHALRPSHGAAAGGEPWEHCNGRWDIRSCHRPDRHREEWLTLVVWWCRPMARSSSRTDTYRCRVGSRWIDHSVAPIVFPVLGTRSYSNAGWLLTARELIHECVDAYAAKMTPVVAVAKRGDRLGQMAKNPGHRPAIGAALSHCATTAGSPVQPPQQRHQWNRQRAGMGIARHRRGTRVVAGQSSLGG